MKMTASCNQINWPCRVPVGAGKWLVLAVSSLILLLAGGCLAPPKIHTWQTPTDHSSVLAEARHWSPLSTNHYVRVDDGRRSQAVSLLEDQSFALIAREQAAAFAPGFSPPPGNDLRTYLVRGVNYGGRPSYTILRFDAPTDRLLVQQATYDGEMMWPTRWVMEPNAFIVYLPRPPSAVYPDGILGGDAIFRGKNWKTLDHR